MRNRNSQSVARPSPTGRASTDTFGEILLALDEHGPMQIDGLSLFTGLTERQIRLALIDSGDDLRVLCNESGHYCLAGQLDQMRALKLASATWISEQRKKLRQGNRQDRQNRAAKKPTKKSSARKRSTGRRIASI